MIYINYNELMINNLKSIKLIMFIILKIIYKFYLEKIIKFLFLIIKNLLIKLLVFKRLQVRV